MKKSEQISDLLTQVSQLADAQELENEQQRLDANNGDMWHHDEKEKLRKELKDVWGMLHTKRRELFDAQSANRDLWDTGINWLIGTAVISFIVGSLLNCILWSVFI